MKKILYLIVVSLLLQFNVNGQNITLMTYNLRLDLASDGENAWPNRKENLVSLIKFYSPDIFGTQEGLPHQVNYINNQLENYNIIGQGREGGNKGEYSAIFYIKNNFKIEKQHTFWLSPTPNKVSKGWDAAYLRICTYALFTDIKTNRIFWVFNTHLDNVGKVAREQELKMILDKINTVNTLNYPVIFMGDFNSVPNSELITDLSKKMNAAKSISIEKPFGPDGTFNAFQFNKPINKRIDYIFVSKQKQIKVKKYAVLSDHKNLKYPSDHLPVFVELKLNN
ncbi:MAG: endonuclease/exonuclease/phosphatase family protein [Lutibacter sp.]|nr:endonuclease/exonuclease/phosphatase family protein [Lutibacter sp.]MCF6180634.1 endonuclease/exonuclease/phosphatase family protein [Lutibacter sp.]